VLYCEAQEILEQDSAIPRFIRVFPTGGILGPVLERFFEVKLDAIDELATGAFDHHLILA
jgi:hypothetical protein